MTLTDGLIVVAALWLLFVACGIPAAPSRTALLAADERFVADVSLYSVSYEAMPELRTVTPPLPDDEARSGAGEMATAPLPATTHESLGSVTVPAIDSPQVLSLTRVTIAPGEQLSLANLDGSGLIVLEEGWLELTRRDGNALIGRSPSATSPELSDADGPPSIAAGDRLSLAPGATIVLHNRNENPARVLTAMVGPVPGFEV
jgi:hypothetical protein